MLGNSFFEGRAWAFTSVVQRANENQEVTEEQKILTAVSSQPCCLALLLLPAISWAGSSGDIAASFA